MKISIIVPNYNGATHLPSCLDSLVEQRFPALELILVDGGSTDCSLQIVDKYKKDIAVCISELDNGQSDAINKGLRRASGDVIAYLNSDDLLTPGSLNLVESVFTEDPRCMWIAGRCRVFGEHTPDWVMIPEGWTALSDTLIPWSRPQRFVFPQSGASFMRRSVVEALGAYDQSLHYAMDMEYYVRAAFRGIDMKIIHTVLAEWRIHTESKTWKRGLAFGFRKDEVVILERYLDRLRPEERCRAVLELSRHKRAVAITEAAWLIENGERVKGAKQLSTLMYRDPLSMFERAWLGALRRIIIPT